ncbi:class I SAM-dependent methyltransferase [Chryseolinea sp. T2]|uniref:class I SAM-dependent methyltransferase n=1 Tax=Chryseolinea sp. T2 TaxID=3129255 RepID=UPI0030777795
MIGKLVKLIKANLPVYKANTKLRSELGVWKKGLYEPGHFYSPVVNKESIETNASFDYSDVVGGIELNVEQQFDLLKRIAPLYSDSLFPVDGTSTFRYRYNNDYFSFSDGIFLSMVMRHFRPSKMIEVGSGFSSAAMLDTNEKFLDGSVDLTFIEPYPENRLNNLISPKDKCSVIVNTVQSVELSRFEALNAGDILFIDSSHVAKYQSDVNFVFFKVLPVLKSGVIIHFHDVFFPFEYPIEWLKQGRSWNEAYLLRAFLMYNSNFEIMLFPSLLEMHYSQWFQKHMPMCLIKHERVRINKEIIETEIRGQSIYLVKR